MSKEETRKPSLFMKESRQLAKYPYMLTVAAIIGARILSVLPEKLLK